jgi:uncharacterized protein YggE
MNFAVGVGFLCCFALADVPGRGKEPAKKVVTTGAATVLLKPDAARVTFAITTTEEPTKSAREANEKQVKKVKEALAALPRDKVDVAVHVLPSSFTNIVSGESKQRATAEVVAKRARSTFHVTVRDAVADAQAAVGQEKLSVLETEVTTPDDVGRHVF